MAGLRIMALSMPPSLVLELFLAAEAVGWAGGLEREGERWPSPSTSLLPAPWLDIASWGEGGERREEGGVGRREEGGRRRREGAGKSKRE